MSTIIRDAPGIKARRVTAACHSASVPRRCKRPRAESLTSTLLEEYVGPAQIETARREIAARKRRDRALARAALNEGAR